MTLTQQMFFQYLLEGLTYFKVIFICNIHIDTSSGFSTTSNEYSVRFSLALEFTTNIDVGKL